MPLSTRGMEMPDFDPVQLTLWNHWTAAIAEEMGEVLMRTAYSPNIKERRDFSCAVFDSRGRLVAQAAHIPVHLGAMPMSLQEAIARFELGPDDLVVSNDPFAGGTHLPDITFVTPVTIGGCVVAYVASRAHHSDVGGIAPGSMGLGADIFQEGLRIPPTRLRRGETEALFEWVAANSRAPDERRGDLRAQLAANDRGDAKLGALIERHGVEAWRAHTTEILAYAERLMRAAIARIPDGSYGFQDALDDNGFATEPVPITATMTVEGDAVRVDFTGSAPQQAGPVNCPLAVTLSATLYVFLCLLEADSPHNEGAFAPLTVVAPEGTAVNARFPAAVAAGNVETSQRIVDVLFGCLGQALPDRIPAASSGTMSNVSIGGTDPRTGRRFAYYETIAGGAGAAEGHPGAPAVQTHMTNTQNTPVEALEYTYPLRVERYEIALGSGGGGRYPGGEGVVREMTMLVDSTVSLLTDRRTRGPYGLAGGGDGGAGENNYVREGRHFRLRPKAQVQVFAGEGLSIRTPGGGGWGRGEPVTLQR